MELSPIRQDQLTERLRGLVLPQGGWLGQARSNAMARLQSMGLPGKRDEYWRFSDPAELTEALAKSAVVFEDSAERAVFGAVNCLKLVFVDGVFDADASDDLTLSGLEIEPLMRGGSVDIHWARELYGTLESRGQNPVPRPFAALNSCFATNGFLIRVSGVISKPISFIYKRKSDSSDVFLHHCIKLEAGAELTVLESGPAAARLSQVMEVDILADARFHHIRVQGRDHQRRACTHLFTRLASNARMKSFTLTANGKMTRNETVIELAGDDAVAHVSGAAMGDGDFHHDDTVFVTHQGQRCESRQVFKKVLKNGAVGVFQGKILVKNSAQKTDGYQTSQALLLDGDCQFLAKPELEIYADDVKCSHGSTSGAIDDGALYYLRSRGIPAKAAQALLVLAFLAEAIAEIDDEVIADDIRARLEAWLARHEH